MKELSIGQKAKAYDEAKDIMEKYLKSGNAGVIAENTIKKAFPELAESEDKQIMKEIAEFIYNSAFKPKDINKKEKWLTWLEKQGEQKETLYDKPEPKFRVGDWVIQENGKLFNITNQENGIYTFIDLNNKVYKNSYEKVEATLRLWSIKDAKDGDVLVVDDRPFIYNGNVNPLSVGGYCGITCDGHFKKYEKPIGHGWTDGWTMYDNNIHPATKEQRDTLFEKMRESGYDWEAEKKELKPIFDSDEAKDSDYHTKGEIIMTRGELLEFLTKEAIKFREKPNFISINKHLTGIDENNMPSKKQIDGVLVAFINHIGLSRYIDYALSYKDLDKEK